MTENQVREYVAGIIKGWHGKKESNGSHKAIIDLYNNHKPLARGYKVKYTDAWCATTISAVAIEAGYTDIIPLECSCEKFIEVAKSMGIWVENDAYIPKIADIVLYDWQDNGVGDNKGFSDHIGMVVAIHGNTLTIEEGNINDAVGTRQIAVNGKYIRGYVTPKYSKKATKKESTPKKNTTTKSTRVKVGDTVMFTGSLHYTSSNSSGIARGCKAGLAKVTSIASGKPHPYHLKAVTGKGATVYGWVNEKDVSPTTANSNKTYTVKKGDTLSSIATKFDTTVNKLVSLNGIRNKDKISVGQIIKLP